MTWRQLGRQCLLSIVTVTHVALGRGLVGLVNFRRFHRLVSFVDFPSPVKMSYFLNLKEPGGGDGGWKMR